MNLIDTLTYLSSKRNQKLGQKEIEKYKKTGKNIHAKKAQYHLDKAHDQELIATAPNKKAKEYIKAKRDEIETDRMKDYLEHGVGKEFYEEQQFETDDDKKKISELKKRMVELRNNLVKYEYTKDEAARAKDLAEYKKLKSEYEHLMGYKTY